MSDPPAGTLGSIFDGDAEEGPRGPDLTWSVEVPRTALGASEGHYVKVPDTLMVDGRPVARAVSAHDDPRGTVLRLPAELPGDRAKLRLRGQGGVADGGRPGDLYVIVTVVDALPARRTVSRTAMAGLGLIAIGVALAPVFVC